MASPLEVIGLLVACGSVAAAILAPNSRWQPAALALALVAAPVLVARRRLGRPAGERPARQPGDDRRGPGRAGGGGRRGRAGDARRIEWAFPVLAFAALALRLPVRIGGETSNLLIPLYLVIASQLVATLGGSGRPLLRPRPPPWSGCAGPWPPPSSCTRSRRPTATTSRTRWRTSGSSWSRSRSSSASSRLPLDQRTLRAVGIAIGTVAPLWRSSRSSSSGSAT